jgi:hypothetical protein
MARIRRDGRISASERVRATAVVSSHRALPPIFMVPRTQVEPGARCLPAPSASTTISSNGAPPGRRASAPAGLRWGYAGAAPVLQRRYPGVVPMGVDPHGSHSRLSLGPNHDPTGVISPVKRDHPSPRSVRPPYWRLPQQNAPQVGSVGNRAPLFFRRRITQESVNAGAVMRS